MPIKKSAILFLMLTVGSLGLLAFAAKRNPVATGIVNCTAAKCSFQKDSAKSFAPWMLISRLLFATGA